MTTPSKSATNDQIWKMHKLIAEDGRVPVWIRDLFTEGSVGGGRMTIEQVEVSKDYLEFLAMQIELAPRGPAWAEELQKRFERLSPYQGQTLQRWYIAKDTKRAFVPVTSDYDSIIYIDHYDVVE
jgi:hypothetical protein